MNKHDAVERIKVKTQARTDPENQPCQMEDGEVLRALRDAEQSANCLYELVLALEERLYNVLSEEQYDLAEDDAVHYTTPLARNAQAINLLCIDACQVVERIEERLEV